MQKGILGNLRRVWKNLRIPDL